MLGSGRVRGLGARRLRQAAAAVATGGILAAVPAVSGCTSMAPPIAVAGAYIPQPTTPGTTVAYLDIRNNGTAADRLVAASTSAGGRVDLLAPDGMRDGTMEMHLVPDIAIPAGGIVRLNPNSYRLRITGAGPMRGGKDVLITLRFAHAGTVSVEALVTNPATGGSGYFLS